MTLTDRTAVELAGLLARREVTARAAVEAHLERIAALDAGLSAFITVAGEQALARADALDRTLDRAGAPVGPLHGVPVSVKDLTDTAGIRTTYGSAVFADHVPAANDLVIERVERAGGIVIGKTNTPEFGFGAICANRLCGPTRNPYDRTLTSAGSSGGAAVAVATGMAPLAHGTDFGGSVRTPASFCGIASIRPTPGLLPAPDRALGWDTLATHGAMARTVADCRLLLDVMAGSDDRDPTSRTRAVDDRGETVRVGATADFGGVAPMSDAVRALFDQAVDAVRRVSGGAVERTSPECGEAFFAFRTLRAAISRHRFGPLLDKHGDAISPTLRWNIEQGAGIDTDRYLTAEAARTRLYRSFAATFRTVDVLMVPAAAILPWPNEAGEVTEIDGRPMGSLIDYLAVTFIVSLVGFPVLTLPVATTPVGLPFGVQFVGRPGEEALLVRFGRMLEERLGLTGRPLTL